MGKRAKQAATIEFPLLDELNLYASSTKGDGNCLFRALSDQVYGDESHHAEIRHKVVSYVEEHGDHFAAFVGEYGETFDQYIRRLYQDGVYGGHIELVGFAECYNRQVAIYQADSMYVLEPQNTERVAWNGAAHIAYHTWEHYSSVRQKGGPQSGVVEFPVPAVPDSSGETEKLRSSEIPRWQVEIVLRSVPDASEHEVMELLRAKDVDTVIEALLMTGDPGPDQPESEDSDQVHGVSSQRSSESKDDTKGPAGRKSKNVNTDADPLLHGMAENKHGAKKQLAKQRRLEKKERARMRKAGVVAQQEPATTSETHKNNSKVIHI